MSIYADWKLSFLLLSHLPLVCGWLISTFFFFNDYFIFLKEEGGERKLLSFVFCGNKYGGGMVLCPCFYQHFWFEIVAVFWSEFSSQPHWLNIGSVCRAVLVYHKGLCFSSKNLHWRLSCMPNTLQTLIETSSICTNYLACFRPCKQWGHSSKESDYM